MDRRSDDHMMEKSRALLAELDGHIERCEEKRREHSSRLIAHPSTTADADDTRALLRQLRETRDELAAKHEKAQAIVAQRQAQ